MSWYPIPKRLFGSDKEPLQKKTTTSKKTKLPTQYRTKRKKCSLCNEKSVRTIQISDKEQRNLCQKHYDQWLNNACFYQAKYTRANGNPL
jgi:hypothetical protein